MMVFKNLRKNILLLLISIVVLFASLSCTYATSIDEKTPGGILGAINEDGDVIYLAPGTYNKADEDTKIIISKNITLIGNGPQGKVIIDGEKNGRIFRIMAINVTFINITFINGNPPSPDSGGAVSHGLTGAVVTFINCTFINNTAYRGGAISNTGGNLTLINCTFINNSASNHGGAVANYASMAGGDSFLTAVNCVFINNTSGSTGGAIINAAPMSNLASGTIELYDCTFINNTAPSTGSGVGGAVSISGNAAIKNCTFINNTANVGGGAINLNPNSFLTLISSVFIDNHSPSGRSIRNDQGNLDVSFSVFLDKGGASRIINNINGAVTLTDNFFFWVNPDIDNSTYMDGLKSKIVNGEYTFQGFYYLLITKNNVLNLGDILSITTKLSYFGPNSGVTDLLPDLNILLNHNGEIANEYSYKLEKTSSILLAEKTNSFNFFGEDHEICPEMTVVVNPKNTVLIVLPVDGTVGKVVQLTAKLTDINGKPISGAIIEFFVNGLSVGTAVTGSDGIARLNYALDSEIITVYYAAYAGDDYSIESESDEESFILKVSNTQNNPTLPDDNSINSDSSNNNSNDTGNSNNSNDTDDTGNSNNTDDTGNSNDTNNSNSNDSKKKSISNGNNFRKLAIIDSDENYETLKNTSNNRGDANSLKKIFNYFNWNVAIVLILVFLLIPCIVLFYRRKKQE